MNTFAFLENSANLRSNGRGDGTAPQFGAGSSMSSTSTRYGNGNGQGVVRALRTTGDGKGDGAPTATARRILLCTDMHNLRARAINLVVRMQSP